MSIQVMQEVWQRFCTGGSEMLVMLCLADWANDEGTVVYKRHGSISQIASRCRIKRRHTIDLLQSLERHGVISITRHAGGLNYYQINIDRLNYTSAPQCTSTSAPQCTSTSAPQCTSTSAPQCTSTSAPQCTTPVHPSAPHIPITINNQKNQKEEEDARADDLVEIALDFYPSAEMIGAVSEAAMVPTAFTANSIPEFVAFYLGRKISVGKCLLKWVSKRKRIKRTVVGLDQFQPEAKRVAK